jgi:hypothetical protein
MMEEIDQQLDGEYVDLVVVPVGVGSLAQAVTSHYKSRARYTRVLTVEPDTAPCLWKSLKSGKPDPIETTYTIMAGLNCGTVSTLAWPILRDGVDGSITVSDYEAHEAFLQLKALGVRSGPCGVASLAALKRLSDSEKLALGLNEKTNVVLISSEDIGDYDIPHSVSIDDPVSLTQHLVQIDSSLPDGGGPGETKIAQYIAAWLQHRDIETHWIEPTPGHPFVVGIVRGSENGKSIMFNGHMDTVTTNGYDGNPLTGEINDGKLYGRGAADMKSGLAAALVATAQAKADQLKGDAIFGGRRR